MSRVWQGLAMAIALAAMTAGGVVITQQGGVEGEANAWINTTGQTCTRSSAPITFEEAQANGWVCGSVDNAWDAINSGDTARVVDGTYTGEWNVTGDKASETFIIGDVDDPTNVMVNGRIYAEGANMTLEGVTFNRGSSAACGDAAVGARIEAANVTFRHVNFWGDYTNVTVWNTHDDFMWEDGEFGEPGTTGGTRDACHGQPIWMESNNGVLRNIRMVDQHVGGGNHMEHVRIQSVQNVTIDRLVIEDGFDVSSGTIFVTNQTPSETAGNGLKVINSIFGDGSGGTKHIAAHTDNILNTNGWVIAYNTFGVLDSGYSVFVAPLGGSSVVVGNLGARGSETNCSGTWQDNVWQHNTSATICAGDTHVNGAAGAVDQLGIDSSGHLLAGSVAIDAAETPGASDYCTDAATVNSRDVDGGTRPQGSVCDAGADETGSP